MWRWVWIIGLAVATTWFAWASVDAFREAWTNTTGGTIPVWAGHREPEIVGEKWAPAKEYRTAKMREAYDYAVISLAGIVASVCILRNRGQENRTLGRGER